MLNLLAYLIIPVYTVLFAWDTNWFTTNFSVIGSWANRTNAFLLWGFIVGIYFFWSLRKIIHVLDRHKKETVLTLTASVLLAFAVLTPYMPNQLPLKSMLHIVFAFLSSVLLILCVGLIIWKLYRINPDKYRPYLYSIIIITIICSVLLVAAGIVSSALEIFFTISFVILVRKLHITATLPVPPR